MSGNDPYQDTILKENAEVTGDPVSPSTAENPPAKRPVRLWLLFGAHIILGPSFGIWLAAEQRIPFVLEHLLIVAVFGFVFAQSSLLGFWAAFAPAKWWMQLVSLLLGCVYFEILIRIGEQARDNFFLLATMATVGITGMFAVVRWRYADLCRVTQQSDQASEEGLKFSIRGLMLFTFVVAVSIVGIRQLRDHISPSPTLLAIAVWSLCFATAGLAGAWAGLGTSRLVIRSVAVLLISAVLGFVFGYTLSEGNGEIYFYTIPMTVLEATLVIASLLVVRSCGYRLVRKSALDEEPLV